MSQVPAELFAARTRHETLRPWRAAGTVVFLLACVFMAYWPSADSLINLWNDTDRTTYTHGFVIAAIVAWLVMRQRVALASLPWTPGIAASVLLLALGMVWIVAVRAGIEIIHQILMLAVLWTSVLAICGARVAWRLCIPIGFLIFAIPIWDFVNFLLQEATVRAVALLVAVSSFSAYVEGNFVHIAAGVFEIAGGCSGLHFMIVGLALGVLYGELGRDHLKVRIQLIALAVGLALLSNWLRVYIIVVAGHLTDMQHYLIRVEHYTFGWVVFSVMMLIFFALARWFAPLIPAEKIADQLPPGAAGMPRIADGLRSARGIVALLCVLSAPALLLLLTPAPAKLDAARLPLQQAPPGWVRAPADDAAAWDPVFPGADLVERAAYANAAGQRIQVFVAAFASQRQDKELIAYGNSLVGIDEGEVVSSARATAGGPASELMVQGRNGRSVIRYYYDIGGWRTNRGIEAQLRYGISSLLRQPVSAVVALRAVCASDCESERVELAEFAKSTEAPGNTTIR